MEQTAAKAAPTKAEPKNGDVDVDHTSGEITFTPKENFFGTETFTVEASDIAGGVNAILSPVTMMVLMPICLSSANRSRMPPLTMSFR